jgi:Family of unknown function (DUF6582)
MGELSTRQRERLPSSKFAYVDSKGGEHLPIHDASHVRNAIARFDQTDFDSAADKEKARKKVLGAARKMGVDVSDDASVSKPAAGKKQGSRS